MESRELVFTGCTIRCDCSDGSSRLKSAMIPASGGSVIPVAVWYPTEAQASEQPLGLFRQTVALNGPVQGQRLRLIVISHGNGGTKDGYYATALALAGAGFVVAALEHTGDNYRDQSRATDVLNRPRELDRLLSGCWGSGETMHCSTGTK